MLQLCAMSSVLYQHCAILAQEKYKASDETAANGKPETYLKVRPSLAATVAAVFICLQVGWIGDVIVRVIQRSGKAQSRLDLSPVSDSVRWLQCQLHEVQGCSA